MAFEQKTYNEKVRETIELLGKAEFSSENLVDELEQLWGNLSAIYRMILEMPQDSAETKELWKVQINRANLAKRILSEFVNSVRGIEMNTIFHPVSHEWVTPVLEYFQRMTDALYNLYL